MPKSVCRRPFFGVIKVKLPSDHLEQAATRQVYETFEIPRKMMAARVRHVIQSTFNGRRMVIFSGGAQKDDNQAIFDETSAIRDGSGFGSIIGRNTFHEMRTPSHFSHAACPR